MILHRNFKIKHFVNITFVKVKGSLRNGNARPTTNTNELKDTPLKSQIHTHTHTHIFIYIYIYIYVCMATPNKRKKIIN